MDRARIAPLVKLGWPLVAVAGAAAAITIGPATANAIDFAAWSLIEMAPVIAAAVLLSALVRATGTDGLLGYAFARGGWIAIGLSAGMGAVTPICGVGVLPIVASLLAAGVRLPPVMAFWLASPITDPGMIAVTAGMLGLPFAVGKTVFAMAIGLVGGGATSIVVRHGLFTAPLRIGRRTAGDAASEQCEPKLLFWRDPNRRRMFREDAFGATVLILKWLTLAFFLEGLLRQYLAPEMVAEVVGRDNDWAIPLAVFLGVPIYLDGYAALPLVRGLMDMGMAPGAAMAFLIAGGITSLYASIAVAALVRPAVFAWYLALAITASLAAGYLWQVMDGVFPA